MQLSLSIPDHATVVPTKGSTIKIGDPLFSITAIESVKVSVASELSIKPGDIFHYVTKAIGDTVQTGEILAQKKKLVGAKQVQSPVAGTIEQIDHTNGDIIIAISSSKAGNEVPSFFSGKITVIDTSKHILSVELLSTETITAKSIPRDFGGPLYFFSDDSLFYTATEKDISGKVIVIADLKNHIAAKFETLGAAAFVYIQGQDSTDVPDITLSKAEFDRLVNAKKKYILFSGFEKKAVIYENA